MYLGKVDGEAVSKTITTQTEKTRPSNTLKSAKYNPLSISVLCIHKWFEESTQAAEHSTNVAAAVRSDGFRPMIWLIWLIWDLRIKKPLQVRNRH